ncbi:MAG: hypothetical protein Q9181_007734 [Wetmoreana brouardii]
MENSMLETNVLASATGNNMPSTKNEQATEDGMPSTTDKKLLQELHSYYRAADPDFTFEIGETQIGEGQEIILADPDGRYPSQAHGRTTHDFLIATEWNKKRVFWTLALGEYCMIVAPVGQSPYRGPAYRRWLGPEKGFDYKDIAFPVDEVNHEASAFPHANIDPISSSDSEGFETPVSNTQSTEHSKITLA